MRARAAAAVVAAVLAATLAVALSWRAPSDVYKVTASTLYGNVTPVMAYGWAPSSGSCLGQAEDIIEGQPHATIWGQLPLSTQARSWAT